MAALVSRPAQPRNAMLDNLAIVIKNNTLGHANQMFQLRCRTFRSSDKGAVVVDSGSNTVGGCAWTLRPCSVDESLHHPTWSGIRGAMSLCRPLRCSSWQHRVWLPGGRHERRVRGEGYLSARICHDRALGRRRTSR